MIATLEMCLLNTQCVGQFHDAIKRNRGAEAMTQFNDIYGDNQSYMHTVETIIIEQKLIDLLIWKFSQPLDRHICIQNCFDLIYMVI